MEINQAVKSLGALAQESRLNVFRLLVKAGPEGLSAGDISDQLKIPPATMSFHLKELAATGLISSSREGRSLIYSLQPEVVNELLQFLMQECCQGRPELCQIDYVSDDACCEKPATRTPKTSKRKS
jgi:ArsR family transcriptional regulator, arsenate/arsenite/antimonite-responsive transcriptional repressor